jgi:hypothetical protein
MSDPTPDLTPEVPVVGDETPLIKSLRKQLKELQKNTPSRAQIEAEVRAEIRREQDLADTLIALGHPAAASSWVLPKLGDRPADFDNVSAILADAGYEPGQTAPASSRPTAPTQPTPAAPTVDPNLRAVSSLSAQVATVVSGGPKTAMQRIAEAQTPAELAAIAAEHGFLQE